MLRHSGNAVHPMKSSPVFLARRTVIGFPHPVHTGSLFKIHSYSSSGTVSAVARWMWAVSVRSQRLPHPLQVHHIDFALARASILLLGWGQLSGATPSCFPVPGGSGRPRPDAIVAVVVFFYFLSFGMTPVLAHVSKFTFMFIGRGPSLMAERERA